MTFLWPSILWFLVLVPLLVVAYLLLLRRKRKTALRYASLVIVKEALGSGPGFRRHVPPLLLLIGLTIMIVAVARPAAIVTLPSQRGTVILTMDISGSMRAQDVQPSRMAAAQQAARAFVAGQPKNVKIGVVAFASSSFIVQSPTLDREAVTAAISRFRMQLGTAVGSGILSSLDAVFEGMKLPFELTPSGRRSILGDIDNVEAPTVEPVPPGTYRSAVIILLTDGQTTHGPDPLQAAQVAADLGVRIYTVGLGTPEGAVIGFGDRSFRVILDEESLMTIADTTGAEYYKADSETDLRKIYEELSAELVFETEKTEITALFTALAAVLAMVAAGFSFAWFGRMV
jgi:Ca-activated chloride channel family protein